jgi:hypothetical protein
MKLLPNALVDSGHLKRKAGDRGEFEGLVHSGRMRLRDARECNSISETFLIANYLARC